ncbi:hypothetical protein BDB00DRAFT_838790 [Zychaea mexicana]|uniref:uncharacterized protein n=1 Tax=Zychaea mexicana TaxID=64656 RepID=UPI0022FE8F63|nr:uncharacterized protein BDB00DRAFT_838790 [Zychaea mexicana]KAI9490212.1 hypothetical protein BDB00DRAFT_838790 [Zychaea mexicana]
MNIYLAVTKRLSCCRSPYCDKSYQSIQKAVNHIIAVHHIRLERRESGSRSNAAYNQRNVRKYEKLGYTILTYYGCVSCKEVFAEKEELRRHCDANHVITTLYGNGLITSPKDVIRSDYHQFYC